MFCPGWIGWGVRPPNLVSVGLPVPVWKPLVFDLSGVFVLDQNDHQYDSLAIWAQVFQHLIVVQVFLLNFFLLIDLS